MTVSQCAAVQDGTAERCVFVDGHREDHRFAQPGERDLSDEIRLRRAIDVREDQIAELVAQLAAMTACRDELAKIAAAREHPDRFPDFDVSLERIGKLRAVGDPSATVAAKWAACEEPPEGDGVRACNWTGEMSQLVTDDFGVTHCPGCGSTALKEDISP